MEFSKIIDISPEISPQMAVFPGDQPFERKVSMEFAKGDQLTLSSIFTTVHLGAHADAPNHYHKDGKGISEVDLDPYLGSCQIITVDQWKGQRIPEKAIKEVKAPRVLLRTLSFPDPNKWNSDFSSLSIELIESFAKQGVKLIGIDTPSIDPPECEELDSHQRVFARKLSILEGLQLSHVEDGLYTLIALPLSMRNCDASPVRAILIP